jgi:hypothetical protein
MKRGRRGADTVRGIYQHWVSSASVSNCHGGPGHVGKQLIVRDKATSPLRGSPNAPLVDFPQGQVLDSLDLLNKVKRQCTFEKVPDFLILF